MHTSQQLSDGENHKRGIARHKSLRQMRSQFDTGIAALLRLGELSPYAGLHGQNNCPIAAALQIVFDKTAPRGKNVDDSVHDPSSLWVSPQPDLCTEEQTTGTWQISGL